MIPSGMAEDVQLPMTGKRVDELVDARTLGDGDFPTSSHLCGDHGFVDIDEDQSCHVYFFPLRFIIEAQVAAFFSAFGLDFSIAA